MNSKERAYLRGLASTEDTILFIGKGGITESVVAETNAALEARELVKGKVQEASPLTPKEACEKLAEACAAEPVQVIGGKFVLYRRRKKDPKIEFPK